MFGDNWVMEGNVKIVKTMWKLKGKRGKGMKSSTFLFHLFIYLVLWKLRNRIVFEEGDLNIQKWMTTLLSNLWA